MDYKTYLCNKCKKRKRFNAFSKNPQNKKRDCRQYTCRACTSKYDAKHYEKFSTRVKLGHLKYYYGITFEQYKTMFEKQGGKCMICLAQKEMWRGERGLGKNYCLYVDHDHATKKVRGLLCSKCNFGLGQFQDNPDLIKRAYAYLKV